MIEKKPNLIKYGLIILAAIAAHVLVTSVAYQFNNNYRLNLAANDVSNDTFNFYPLTTVDDPTETPFKWSMHKSGIAFKGIAGGTDYTFRILARARRYSDDEKYLKIMVGDKTVFEGLLTLDWDWYEIEISKEMVNAGEFAVTLYTKPQIIEKQNHRIIRGVRVSKVELISHGSGFKIPAIDQIFKTGIIILLILLVAVIGRMKKNRFYILFGALEIILFIIMLTPLRDPFLRSTDLIIYDLLVVNLSALIVAFFARKVFLKTIGKADINSEGKIVLVSSLSLFAKSSLWFVPYTYSIDLVFHKNLYVEMFTESIFQLSHAGGLKFPYPPAFYVLLYPFNLVITNEALLIKIIFTFLFGFVPFLVYIIAYKFLGNHQNAFTAMLLYVCLPKTFYIYLLGIVANGFGHLAYILAVALIFVFYEKLDKIKNIIILTAAFTLVNLSHFGMFISFLIFIISISMALFIHEFRNKRIRDVSDKQGLAKINEIFKPYNSLRLFSIYIISAGISFFIYYIHLIGPTLKNIARLLTTQEAVSDGGGVFRISTHNLIKVGQNIIGKFGLFTFILGIVAVVLMFKAGKRSWQNALVFGWFAAYILQLYLALTEKLMLRFELFALPLFAVLAVYSLQRINKRWLTTSVIILTLIISLYLWITFNGDIGRLTALIIPHKNASWVIW
ncbi:MAG: hypothetical protein JW737_10405 [Acidobacteria bacterium]|nr:hypothetical protein [Acidobacteriota bacterium]